MTEPLTSDQRNPWRDMILGGCEKPWPYGWVLARELIPMYQVLDQCLALAHLYNAEPGGKA